MFSYQLIVGLIVILVKYIMMSLLANGILSLSPISSGIFGLLAGGIPDGSIPGLSVGGINHGTAMDVLN